MLLSAISGAVFADYYEVINDTLANPTLYGSVYANEKYIFVGEGGSIYLKPEKPTKVKPRCIWCRIITLPS